MRFALLIAGMAMLACPAAAGEEWQVHVRSNDVTSVWADAQLVYWGSTAGTVIHDPSTDVYEKVLKSVGGLASNRLTAILKDEGGRLWIGTKDAGVSVLAAGGGWTTHSTQNLSLLSDEVRDISTHGAWTVVATSGGISLFEDAEFRTFFDGTDWSGPDCSDVLAVALNGDEILIGTECGAFAYDLTGRIWSDVLADTTTGIDYDGSNLFWVVTAGSIYTYDGSALALIPKTFIKNDDIYDIGAADTTVWVATSNGPSRYDAASQQWMRNVNALPANLKDARSIFVGADDLVWIGTEDGAGNLAGGSWVLHLSEGPAGNYVQDLVVDMAGMVWCATGTRGSPSGDQTIGLLKFDGLGWEHITPPTLANNNTYAVDVHPVDGSLWVGFWIGGLMSRDASTGAWDNHRDKFGNVISDVYIRSDGAIFVGEYLTGIGILCPDGSDIHYEIDDSPLCVGSQCVSAIGAAPDGVLIGGHPAADVGITCPAIVIQLDTGAECDSKLDDVCESWGELAGWVQGTGNAVTTDVYGIGWLGTSGGLSSYDGRWQAVSGKLGAVWDIEVDAYGARWVATDRGLYVLEGYGTEWEHFEKSVRVYDSSNSPLGDSPVKALDFDADGALWIGTGGGGIYRLKETGERDLKQWVDVFPNPYYAWQDTDDKGIRFTGFMPGREIRVFTLAGDLVTVISPDEPWFGTNASGEEVVPGVYIYHAYAQDGGEFVGKLAIVR